MKLTIDFETRSTCDLTAANAFVYADDPATQIICLAVQADDSGPVIWLPKWTRDWFDTPEALDMVTQDKWALLPTVDSNELQEMFRQADEVEAHNAGFEQCIWGIMVDRYGFDPIPLNKWRCSMAKGLRMNLPASLKKLGQALGSETLKNDSGRALMLKMCKPRIPRKAEKEADPDWESHVYWHEEPEQILELCEYCLQDVRAEYSLNGYLQELPERELRLWRMDQEINQRGVKVDLPLVDALSQALADRKAALLDEFCEVTGGAVTTVKQTARFKKWMAEHDVHVDSIAKDKVSKIMSRPDLPDAVRRALEIRQALGPSSVDKLQAMARKASADDRVRGAYVYHKASTGRWASRGLQLQNVLRPLFDDTDEAAECFLKTPEIARIIWGDYGLEQFAGSLLRSCLIPEPGRVFLSCDFSSVEGRILAWIADETHVLDLYRNGVDLYKHVASVIYGIPVDQVTKAQRQIGKVAMLALGYQGWVTAFQAMAVGYGVKISDYEAMKVARQWRKDRPKTVRLWEDCEKAAASALAERGKVFSAGMCHFAADKDWLFIRLPSSRTLFYREPHFRKVTRTYGERVVEKVVLHYWGTDSQSGRWMVQGLHGGKIVENIVQAIGRDLQADAMLDMVDYDWRIVMHTHDEVTAESRHPDSLEDFCYLMKQTPDWAPGLPIEAEGWTGPRYRK